MKTYSINGVEINYYKNMNNNYQAFITKTIDSFTLEINQFEIENLLGKQYKTAKEIKNKVDDFVMSLKN